MTIDFFDLLSLERLDKNLYRSRFHQENHRKILFGGQVLGQALYAANETIADTSPPRPVNSCHAYFLHPGNSDTPVIYDVDVLKTGTSFTTARVLGRQNGRVIFSLAASYHALEPGYAHQTPQMPKTIPAPDVLHSMADCLNKLAPEENQHVIDSIDENPYIELKPVLPNVFGEGITEPPECFFWLKARQPLPDDPAIHRTALAFASDLGLLATSVLPHPNSIFSDKMHAASLDHAIWFHQDFRCDEWLLYQTDSPWAGHGRGLNRGLLYNQDGVLVASTAQEGLIRQV